MEQIRLGDDRWCYACGEKNPRGLKLSFTLDGERALHTTFTFGKEYQGYTDIIHGGFISLILDEIMLNLAWRQGYKAVTAGLELRFKKAVRVGDTIHFKGWLAGREKRLLSAGAEARDENGEIVATARAKCLLIEIEKGSA